MLGRELLAEPAELGDGGRRASRSRYGRSCDRWVLPLGEALEVSPERSV
jgi:hypothetical protein